MTMRYINRHYLSIYLSINFVSGARRLDGRHGPLISVKLPLSVIKLGLFVMVMSFCLFICSFICVCDASGSLSCWPFRPHLLVTYNS